MGKWRRENFNYNTTTTLAIYQLQLQLQSTKAEPDIMRYSPQQTDNEYLAIKVHVRMTLKNQHEADFLR